MPLRLLPLLVFLGLLGLVTGPTLSASAATYYVSLEGNDANAGLGPEASQALRTIQAGVDRLQPGDTLCIRGGTYRETVTFHRSGTAEQPIRVEPYPHEKVILSGCDVLDCLQPEEGNVWQTAMPWTLGLGRNQVFCDGEVLIEARIPNVPSSGPELPVRDLSPLWPTFGEFSIPKETEKEQPGRLVSKLLEGQADDYWKGALYYGVHHGGWAAQTGVIESSRSGEIQVGDRTKGWWFTSESADVELGRGMIVGHRHALDAPGEWVWQDNRLLLILPEGKTPTARIEAKRRQLALDLSGCEHVQLRGLNVTAASVRMQDSAWCTFDGCDFRYISHYLRHYGIGEIEHDHDTIKSGETGIFVGGHDNAFLNCTVQYSAGAGFHLRGYHHTIHNCLINEIDYTSHYLNAITDAVGDFHDYENFLVGGHIITYNTMRNAGRHFFNFYGNGTSLTSRDRSPMDYLSTLFAHNHLYNGELETRDAGFLTGYYCSGGTLNGLNAQVAYNVLHDCYDMSAMRWNLLGLVYLDAGTCQVDLHHNLLWAAPGSLQHGLWYNTCCVHITEHDNLFHKEFTRSCAELKPEDFPEGKPFRFGQDLANPPLLPKWPQLTSQPLEAAACTTHSPGIIVSADGLSGLTDGEWFSFDGIDCDAAWQSAVLRFASDQATMNTDVSMRARPRHQKATDPLVLEAEFRDAASPGIKPQWTFITEVQDQSWIRFDRVPLGDGYRRIRACYGTLDESPRWVEVHLDRLDGPLVGKIPLTRTDQKRGSYVQIYEYAVAELTPEAQGTHDLYFAFRSEDGKNVGEFEYFRLEQYRGTMPLQKNEVQLEIRLGGPTGEKIGQFYPRPTGGATQFRELVAQLEPAHGKQPLFFVVRSDLAAPAGTIAWVRLDKAAAVTDWTGIGVPARQDAQGKLILPEATHRPR